MAASDVIVLAEDDPRLRKLYSDWLTVHGYDVLSAPDGVQALGLISKVTPSLILLDIMMPNLNGIEVCKRVRKIVGDNVPIVFLSALDRLDILHECLTAGGDDYLIKTSSLDHILNRVTNWIQRPRDQQLSERRAKILTEISAKVANETSTTTNDVTLSSETQQSIREITEFVHLARVGAAEGFGKTVEDKLYMLGYVTGVVEHWSILGAPQEESFIDRLNAVLHKTGILTNREIRDMVTGFEELAADLGFAIARVHGRNDTAQRQCKGDDYAPVGLTRLCSLT